MTKRRPTEREPTEYEVTGGMPAGAPSSIAECPEYADAEIGLVARGLMAGWSLQRIADELGLNTQNVPDSLRNLVREIRSLRDHAQPQGRHRHLSAADEASARHLRYDRKHTIAEIARRLGCSEGAVTWSLAHPRAGGDT